MRCDDCDKTGRSILSKRDTVFVSTPGGQASSTQRTTHSFPTRALLLLPFPWRHQLPLKQLAIGWLDGQVSAWSVMDTLQENASTCTCSNQGVHKQPITTMLWNPSGTRLVTGDKVLPQKCCRCHQAALQELLPMGSSQGSVNECQTGYSCAWALTLWKLKLQVCAIGTTTSYVNLYPRSAYSLPLQR